MAEPGLEGLPVILSPEPPSLTFPPVLAERALVLGAQALVGKSRTDATTTVLTKTQSVNRKEGKQQGLLTSLFSGKRRPPEVNGLTRDYGSESESEVGAGPPRPLPLELAAHSHEPE